MVLVPGAKLFVEVVGYESARVFFKNLHPDIVVVLKNLMFICELTFDFVMKLVLSSLENRSLINILALKPTYPTNIPNSLLILSL